MHSQILSFRFTHNDDADDDDDDDDTNNDGSNSFRNLRDYTYIGHHKNNSKLTTTCNSRVNNDYV